MDGAMTDLSIIYRNKVGCPVLWHDIPVWQHYEWSSSTATLYMVGWLCLTFHRQRGHLERASPFTVSCEGREAR